MKAAYNTTLLPECNGARGIKLESLIQGVQSKVSEK